MNINLIGDIQAVNSNLLLILEKKHFHEKIVPLKTL